MSEACTPWIPSPHYPATDDKDTRRTGAEVGTMRTVDLAGGRVTVTVPAGVAFDQQCTTLAVPYGTQDTVAPVTAARCTWTAAPGAAITVAVTLPAPVCGLG